MVVYGQKWIYSGKSGFIRAKVVIFEHGGCMWAKLNEFGQSGCIRAKVVVFGQKWLYSGRSGCIRGKVVVIARKWF